MIYWNGVKIDKKIDILNYKFLIGEKTIIFLISDLNEKKQFFDIFKIMKFFLNESTFNLNKSELIFGLFRNNWGNVVKKKTIKNFLHVSNEYTFLSLLSGSNIDAYYENKHETENFLGLEFRYAEELIINEKVLWVLLLQIINPKE